MADETITTSIHELLRLRGDVAIAGLKAIHGNLLTLVNGIGATLAEMDRLEAHYTLSDTVGQSPMASLVATVRRMRPRDTEGMTDAEVMQMLKSGGGGA